MDTKKYFFIKSKEKQSMKQSHSFSLVALLQGVPLAR